MVKKLCGLLLAAVLLALLAACGTDAGQPTGDIAAAMADVTADRLDFVDPEKYTGLTLEQLASAMNAAALCQITAEEGRQTGAENGEFLWFIGVKVHDGPCLMLSCSSIEDIVHVTDIGAAASSSYPMEREIDAYFRHPDLYQLVRHAKDAQEPAYQTVDMAEHLRRIRPEDIGAIPDYYPKVTAQQAADALNSAAEHQITGEQAIAEGYADTCPFWRMELPDTLYAQCGLTENVVFVRYYSAAERGEGYFRNETLYDLVRHCRDYDEVIDQAAYARFKPQIDAVMQQELDAYANTPGEFHAYQLMNFSPVWQYETPDGNRAEWYDFDFALIPDRPDRDFWAGGLYMDSQLRVRGFFVCGSVVARYQNDTFLGLVFMAGDDSYGTQPFETDPVWVEGMLAAAGIQ